MSTFTLNLAEKIAPILASRDVIDSLIPQIVQAQQRSVSLDFIAVESVSRSAAHALVKMKRLLATEKPSITVTFENPNIEVAHLLEVVSHDASASKLQRTTPPLVSFESLLSQSL